MKFLPIYVPEYKWTFSQAFILKLFLIPPPPPQKKKKKKKSDYDQEMSH